MRDVEIGFYAHHHGHGHLQRARAIAAHIQHPVTIFSSLADDCTRDRLTHRHLPLDYEADTNVVSFDHLHYAPLNIEGLRQRARILTTWFVEHWPCLLVVDVSVEVATLARLCGVPTIYVRQRGGRFDEAHRLAYETATRLLAPYPAEWDEPEIPQLWRDRTEYTGLISRYETTPRLMPKAVEEPGKDKTVTVLTGYGGTAITVEALTAAACATPEWQWTVLGPVEKSQHALPKNLRLIGTIKDPAAWLTHADVVVGSAGDSVVSEIAHLQRRFVCIPEQRPYDEQQSTAAILHRLKIAIVLPALPAPTQWKALLHRALEQDPAQWDAWRTGGSKIAAQTISRIANDVFFSEKQSWTF